MSKQVQTFLNSPKLKWISSNRKFIMKHISNYSILSKKIFNTYWARKVCYWWGQVLLKSRELITRPVVQDSFLHLLHHRLHDLEILATAGSLAFSISNCKAAFQPPVQCSAANAMRNQVLPAQTMNSFSILMKINFSSSFERDWPHRASKSLFC